MFAKLLSIRVGSLLLKATTTKTITVPGYTRADGTFVPPHSKIVHYDPDKASPDVISGNGSYSQKKAHKKLSRLPHWPTLTDEEKHAHVLSSATNIQQKESRASALTKLKKQLAEGVRPEPKQWQEFAALPEDARAKLLASVQIGDAGAKLLASRGYSPTGGALKEAENRESANAETQKHADTETQEPSQEVELSEEDCERMAARLGQSAQGHYTAPGQDPAFVELAKRAQRAGVSPQSLEAAWQDVQPNQPAPKELIPKEAPGKPEAPVYDGKTVDYWTKLTKQAQGFGDPAALRSWYEGLKKPKADGRPSAVAQAKSPNAKAFVAYVSALLGEAAPTTGAGEGPKEGDRNAEGLIFRGGRWHREGEENAADEPPAVDPDIARRAAQVAKLRQLGQKTVDDASAEQDRDRNTNTARRANMAAGAIADAAKREAIGKTMLNLADAIEAGDAKYLSGVSTRADVETLSAQLARAMHASDKGLTYAQERERRGRDPEPDDIRHAKITRPAWGTGGSSASKVIDALKGKRGAKPSIDKIRYSSGPDTEILAGLKKYLTPREIEGHLGWWNVAQVAEVRRLEKMGIKSDLDLRLALTEFVMYREGRRKEDPVKAAERAIIGQKVGVDFFPTPAVVADRMVELAGIKPGMKVLEPSAGNGNLADAAKAAGAEVDTLEISSQLRDILTAKGHKIAGHDFETHEAGEDYDAVIMNPPFSDRRDAAHIMRAYSMLKPGGTLVAIAGEGVFNGSDKRAQEFRSWLDERDATVEKLPDGTFKDSKLLAQTGANARLLVVEKPGVAAAKPVEPVQAQGFDPAAFCKIAADDLSKLRADDVYRLFEEAPKSADAFDDLRVYLYERRPDLGATIMDAIEEVGMPSRESPVSEDSTQAHAAERKSKGEKIRQYLADGGNLMLATHSRAFQLSNPDQVRVADSGVYVRTGKGLEWSFLTDDQINILAGQVGSAVPAKAVENPAERAPAGDKPMKNYGWDRVKLADAYDLKELSKLREQVAKQHANPQDENGRYIENGQPTINMVDKEGRRKLDAVAWATRNRMLANQAEAEDGPHEGDRNAAGLVLRDGRWHRDGKPAEFDTRREAMGALDAPEKVALKKDGRWIAVAGQDVARLKAHGWVNPSESGEQKSLTVEESLRQLAGDRVKDIDFDSLTYLANTVGLKGLDDETRLRVKNAISMIAHMKDTGRLDSAHSLALRDKLRGDAVLKMVQQVADKMAEGGHPLDAVRAYFGGSAKAPGEPLAVTERTRRKDADGNSYVELKLSDGTVRRIVRLNSTESMGLPGWHDMDKDQHSFLADSEDGAVNVILGKKVEPKTAAPALSSEQGSFDFGQPTAAKDHGKAKDLSGLLVGFPEGAEFVRGKGLIAGRYAVAVNGDTVGGFAKTPELAVENARREMAARENTKNLIALKEAHWAAVAEKVRAGKEVTDADLKMMGLKSGASDLRWFIPAAAHLFGISSRQVRPYISDMVKVGHTDMGAKREFVPPKKALAAIAAGLKDGNAPSPTPTIGAGEGPKDGDRNSEGLVFRDGRWHRDGEESVLAEGGQSDDPNSPNYRFRDTGYIAGSRKEQAAESIKRAAKAGTMLRVTDIDWEEIEKNPREAAQLIVKSNLFGKVGWDALREGGMSPAAGFLVDRVYASVPKEPDGEASAQRRQDYALGIESLRERLEKCKTPEEVTDQLNEIREELEGTTLNEEQTARYAKIRGVYQAKSDAADRIKKELEGLNAEWAKANRAARIFEHDQELRVRRGWKPDPKLQAQIDALQPAKDAAQKAVEEFREKHPELEEKRRDLGDGWSAFDDDLGFELRLLRNQMNDIVSEAKTINIMSNPATRAWVTMGPKFLAVLNYRRSRGSDAFAGHVANAKNGKITDWSWAEKEVSTVKKASKREVTFQLKVAENFERKGGRAVTADSTAAFKEKFGLRDVQSGNWVLDDPTSAAWHVQRATEAFADLADLIGVPDHLVSVNGRLALAFGARGHGNAGWKGSARAHYEPIQRVINLTKMGGGGALGHEWAHALDNLCIEAEGGKGVTKGEHASTNPDALPPGELRDAFSAVRSAMLDGNVQASQELAYSAKDIELADFNMVTRAPNKIGQAVVAAGNAQAAVKAVEDYYGRTYGDLAKMRPKLKKQFNDWRRVAVAFYDRNPEGGTVAVKAGPGMSSFAAEAAKLDGGGAEYWSETHEMFARAFQAYCEDRLASQGRQNDYLSAFADNKYYVHPIFGQSKPFPEGEERVRINAAFDKLVAALRGQNTLAKALRMMEARPLLVVRRVRESVKPQIRKRVFLCTRKSV